MAAFLEHPRRVRQVQDIPEHLQESMSSSRATFDEILICFSGGVRSVRGRTDVNQQAKSNERETEMQRNQRPIPGVHHQCAWAATSKCPGPGK